MPVFMGIDIGSRTSKGVIIKDGEIIVSNLFLTGAHYHAAAEKLRKDLLSGAGLRIEEISRIVGTGHTGSVPFSNEDISDIVCCARGIRHVFPSVRTVIDIQAQSSQVIRLNEKGQVTSFVVSEKCAAGSGFFLDVIANVLRMDIGDIGPISLKSQNPVVFSTACAVFGESEAISRVAEGCAKEDILAGVHNSLAEKISALVGRVGMEMRCAVSGGGACDVGLIRSLEVKLSVPLLVPSHPQLITALGAAIVAQEKAVG